MWPVGCGDWCRVQQVNRVLVTVAYEHPPGHLLMCLLHFIAQTPDVCNVLITAINLVLLTLSKQLYLNFNITSKHSTKLTRRGM